MQAGSERDALCQIANRLCDELGYGDAEAEASRGFHSPLVANEDGLLGLLTPEDRSLVAAIRLGLSKLAAAIGREEPGGPVIERAIEVALDGAELVMRGELVGGNPERLPGLMPSFVFLVTLPLVDQDEALELSRRTSELIDGTLGG